MPVLEVLRKILELEGHEVFQALNGVEGVNLFREMLPDLVVTDVFMPEKTGIGVIQELQRPMTSPFQAGLHKSADSLFVIDDQNVGHRCPLGAMMQQKTGNICS